MHGGNLQGNGERSEPHPFSRKGVESIFQREASTWTNRVCETSGSCASRNVAITSIESEAIVVSKEDWQKTRPDDMSPEQWEGRRERTSLESIALVFRHSWKMIVTFLGLVAILIMTPFAQKIADWVLSSLGLGPSQ